MEYPALTHELVNKLIEAVKTGIILTDTKGFILFANDFICALLGYPRNSLIGKSVDILFSEDDVRIFLRNIMNMTLRGNGFEGEALLRKHDYGPLFVHLSTVLYSQDPQQNELIIFTVQDITPLKRLRRDYLDAERFRGLGKMTDQIAHQIKNPIVSIGGFAQRLAQHQISSDQYVHYAKIIHEEAGRLELIINRLVEFAKIHSPNYQSVMLPSLISELIHSVGKTLRTDETIFQGIAFGSLITMPLLADPVLLMTALQCILQNAAEAIPHKGKVEIGGDIIGEQAIIQVVDTGEGIPPENMPYVFDPFFTTKYSHLGLGLTTANRIVKEHGGSIEVSSVQRQGTEVRILLPKDRRRPIRTQLLFETTDETSR